MSRSTHFYPQPAAAGAMSPARPSTARSTIRAITPSPPGSFDDAQPLQRTAPPSLAYKDLPPGSQMAERDDARSMDMCGGSSAKHVSNTQDGFGSMGASVNPSGAALRRGIVTSRCSSPVKKRARSHSPQKQPFSLPALRTRTVPQEQNSEVSSSSCYSTTEHDFKEEADRYDQDGPETPTPMSREQRSQAYTPLCVPSPLFATVHKMKRKHSVDDVRETPGHALHPKHALCQPTPFEQDFRLHAREPGSAARIRENVPGIRSEGQTTPPLKSPSTLDPTRHTSSSARSNISGGTVASRHSVFSTPGRDELERKKALVEIDEGPFARAVSVQDLDARRRQINPLNEERQYGKRDKKRWMKGCGLGGRCCVM